jgi:hypothetical protein
MRAVWILNLDADLEFAAATGGVREYVPRDAVLAAMAPRIATVARALDARVIDERTEPDSFVGVIARAWSPTPRAQALAARAGATLVAHPSFEVLRHVNGRAFCAALGDDLEGAVFVDDVDRACAILRSHPPVGAAWRIKRAFGMAGRGQRIVAPGAIDAAVLGAIRAGVREGGLQIEPHVSIESEWAIHGIVAEDGSLREGPPLRQHCDRSGAWIASEPVPRASAPSYFDALEREVVIVGAALRAAGYFGPFGIDAFAYRAPSGIEFRARSEINARMSMGFPASGLFVTSCKATAVSRA